MAEDAAMPELGGSDLASEHGGAAAGADGVEDALNLAAGSEETTWVQNVPVPIATTVYLAFILIDPFAR